jgi:3-hydroxyisobutyrate dehydrogenase-like beta-hydroxyacid dehydrogenase
VAALADGDFKRVAFLGLGIMGSRMAANLARAGVELAVWNRTREKAERFAAEHGGRVADSPADAAADADVAITMVVDGPQVEAVLLGDDGVASGAAKGLLCIDMSTIAPSETRAIGARLAERGIRFMDAPVTGSSPKAQDGTLTIMAGGEREDFERASPLFDVMGELIVYAGALGEGEMVKLVNNAVAAANAMVVGHARPQGPRDALARLHDAVQGRTHAQGRAAVPRGGAARRGALPDGRRGPPAARRRGRARS